MLIHTKGFLQTIIENSSNRQSQNNANTSTQRSSNGFANHDPLEGSSRDFSAYTLQRDLSFRSDISFASSEASLTRNFRNMFNISSNDVSNQNIEGK